MHTNNTRKISSTYETWWNRIFGLIFAAVWCSFTILVIVRTALPWWPVLGAAFAAWLAVRNWRLKTVEIDGSELVISNLGRETRVPLGDVVGVTGGRGNIPIKLEFSTPTIFGDSIQFLPGFSWGEHPLVNELKQLCGSTSTSLW